MPRMLFFLLINVKMPTIDGILTFMSRKIFMLSWVENEKSFITSGPELNSYHLKFILLCCLLYISVCVTPPTDTVRLGGMQSWSNEIVQNETGAMGGNLSHVGLPLGLGGKLSRGHDNLGLRVEGPLKAVIFPTVSKVPLHTAFHYHPTISSDITEILLKRM